MNVPVVNVRVMRVAVLHSQVFVQMAVPALAGQIRCVRMLMVFIMGMRMVVLQNLMQVFVGMVFRQVQPYAPSHQCCGNPERPGRRFRQYKQGNCRSNERSC